MQVRAVEGHSTIGKSSYPSTELHALASLLSPALHCS